MPFFVCSIGLTEILVENSQCCKMRPFSIIIATGGRLHLVCNLAQALRLYKITQFCVSINLLINPQFIERTVFSWEGGVK